MGSISVGINIVLLIVIAVACFMFFGYEYENDMTVYDTLQHYDEMRNDYIQLINDLYLEMNCLRDELDEDITDNCASA